MTVTEASDEDHLPRTGQVGQASGHGTPTSRGAQWGRWIGIASIGVAIVVLAVRVGWYHRSGLMPDMVLDDSYISFRYARNLVRGHGLVFNVDERVEGYTNFLWTVAVAGGMAGGLDPEPATEILAATAALGTIVLLAWLSRRVIIGPLAEPSRLLPPLLFAAIGSQARHVISGLETLLFVFLVLAGFASLYQGHRRFPPERESDCGAAPMSDRVALATGLLFGLAALTRPEGLLYAGIAVLWAAWEGSRRASETTLFRRLRPAVLVSGGVLLLVVPHLAWRWSFYGYPLPNTFYAKVAGSLSERLERGWQTLYRGLEDWAIWPILALAVLAIPATRTSRFWLWSYLISVTTVASFLLVGGDFVHSFGPRLLMPALPFVLLLSAEGLRRTIAALPGIKRVSWVGSLVVTVVVLLVAVHALVRPWPTPAGRLGGLARVHHAWRETGEWFRKESDPKALIATTTAGILPYVSDRPVLDMFGLTDEHIAHHAEVDPAMPPAHGKSDPAYVLDRRPDYLHVIHLTPEGIPETAGLGWVAKRVADEYEVIAQVKARRGPLVQGQWVIETPRFRPRLYQRGYTTGIFRRTEDESRKPRREPTPADPRSSGAG